MADEWKGQLPRPWAPRSCCNSNVGKSPIRTSKIRCRYSGRLRSGDKEDQYISSAPHERLYLSLCLFRFFLIQHLQSFIICASHFFIQSQSLAQEPQINNVPEVMLRVKSGQRGQWSHCGVQQSCRKLEFVFCHRPAINLPFINCILTQTIKV